MLLALILVGPTPVHVHATRGAEEVVAGPGAELVVGYCGLRGRGEEVEVGVGGVEAGVAGFVADCAVAFGRAEGGGGRGSCIIIRRYARGVELYGVLDEAAVAATCVRLFGRWSGGGGIGGSHYANSYLR